MNRLRVSEIPTTNYLELNSRILSPVYAEQSQFRSSQNNYDDNDDGALSLTLRRKPPIALVQEQEHETILVHVEGHCVADPSNILLSDVPLAVR